MKGLVAFALALGIATAASAADFDMDSSFPANPTVGTGQFAFDLTMQVSLSATGVNGSFTVYVNSRDGSMALENPHTTLWALGMKDIPDLQVHQVIARTGEIMVCGIHPETGKGCLTLAGNPAAFWAPIREGMLYRDASTFFASVPRTNQNNVPCCQPGTAGAAHMAGKGVSGEKLVFWFDPGAATVRTQRPFLGPGVGIMKDAIGRTNRVVRHFWVDPPEGQSPVGSIMMHLDRLTSVHHSIDVSSYPFVSAFGARSIGDSLLLSDWMRSQGADIQSLARTLEDCLEGEAGADCRAHYRDRIKRIEAEIKARVLDFGVQNGLPGLGD